MHVDMKFSITPQQIDLDLEDIQQVTQRVPVPVQAEVDKTLTREGYAADAKAVGDALKETVKSVNGVKPDADGNITIELPEPTPGTGPVDVSEIDAEKVIFPNDLTTTTAIGNIKLENGQATIEAAGKNLVEVWNSIFVKEQNPTITQPSVSATFSEAKEYEVGTEVTPTYSATLNPGKYQFGPATGVEATAWSVTDTAGNHSDEAAGSFPGVYVEDNVSYRITIEATHGYGAIPQTNLGNAYAAGQIKAGTKTVTSAAITGYRNSFYGTMEEKTTLDSAAIRSLRRTGEAITDGASFKITIPAGALRVVIAYPATIRDISSVKDENGLNAEISSGFARATVDVEGANGHSAIPYKVYYLDFATANTQENTYAVTI